MFKNHKKHQLLKTKRLAYKQTHNISPLFIKTKKITSFNTFQQIK